MALLAALNEWRVSEGLAPLRPNPVLDQVANNQAAYVLSLLDFPLGEDLHKDQDGLDPRQRLNQKIGWPFYNTPAQTAADEIANVGRNERAAIEFWQNSAIHRATATNPGYREVGITAIPMEFGGYFYMAVLASRPDVLPALVDPSSGRLYLTSERYRWSAGGAWIHEVTQVQVLPSASSPIDPAAWQPWQASIPAPQTQGPFAVAYSDGVVQVIIPVDPQGDIAWLPGNLPAP
jgi:hypothetical protein